MPVSFGPKAYVPAPASAGEVTVTTWDNQSVSLATAVSLDGSNQVSFAVNTPGRYKVNIKRAAFPGEVFSFIEDILDDTIRDTQPNYARRVEKVNTVATSGATQTIPDVTLSTISNITLSANCTLTFPTAAAGKSFRLALTQGSGGSKLVTWPASAKWAGGAAPTLSTVAAKTDVFEFVCIDGTNWYGHTVGIDIR
jgi:hypothetical protein